MPNQQKGWAGWAGLGWGGGSVSTGCHSTRPPYGEHRPTPCAILHLGGPGHAPTSGPAYALLPRLPSSGLPTPTSMTSLRRHSSPGLAPDNPGASARARPHPLWSFRGVRAKRANGSIRSEASFRPETFHQPESCPPCSWVGAVRGGRRGDHCWSSPPWPSSTGPVFLGQGWPEIS